MWTTRCVQSLSCSVFLLHTGSWQRIFIHLALLTTTFLCGILTTEQMQ